MVRHGCAPSVGVNQPLVRPALSGDHETQALEKPNHLASGYDPQPPHDATSNWNAFTTRGEPVFTSFDIDSEQLFREYTARPAGVYTSRC
ncbi:MAG: hypothetical protein QM473_02775, partial [Acidobacteriota bacterium]|nr:hypothetical protein [Acidobacteriota bacterium]